MLQILREQLYSIYSVLKFFQILFTHITEVNKRTKTASFLSKINSIESFTRDMALKYLPETIHELNILQKIFQDLTQHDNLVMQLT